VLLRCLSRLALEPAVDPEALGWVLVGYKPSETSTLQVQETGRVNPDDVFSSPWQQFRQYLKPTAICFVVFRVCIIPDQYKEFAVKDPIKYIRSTWGLFHWQGTAVSVMAKALSSHHWKDFSEQARRLMEADRASIASGHFFASEQSEIEDHAVLQSMGLISPRSRAPSSS